MAEIKNIYEKLGEIQLQLKAPKSQYNKFSKFNYRSTEDILEALKPLLRDTKTVIVFSDKPRLRIKYRRYPRPPRKYRPGLPYPARFPGPWWLHVPPG